MAALRVIVLVIHIMLTVGIMVFVLLHAGKGGGLSGLFGGASGPIGGTSIVQKNLDRITIVAAAAFAVTTIALIFIYK